MRTPSLLSLAAALAASLVAREAAACLDLGRPCAGVEAFTSVEPVVAGAGVPTDGLLLLQFQGPATGEPALELVELQVTLDGAPVPGALEDVGVSRVLAWRPGAPLVPGGQYVVEGTVTNPDFSPGPGDCGAEVVAFAFEFPAAPGPMPPLTQPTVFTEESVVVTGADQLGNYVCCDGAYPYEAALCGGVDVYFDEGHCAYLQSTGNLRIDRTLKTDTGGATSMLHFELKVDGVADAAALAPTGEAVLIARVTKPVCTEVVVRNLATGETLSTPQQCHGQDVADQLGMQELTPTSPALVDHCAGQPYRCMLDDTETMWDPARCEPWPPEGGTTGEPTTGDPPSGSTGDATGGSSGGSSAGPGADGLVDHGCACTGDPPRSPAALPLLLALACAPRRRRR